tara:strand:+ start:2386 stop:2592 length:207 start_codon:yes stop_codon:yes gene_type:complete
MNILLTLISVLLIILSILTFFSVVILGLLYWKIRELRKEINVIFDASVNVEEFLAAMSSDKGSMFSAN